jgi:DHA2 family multidrug resistance protein
MQDAGFSIAQALGAATQTVVRQAYIMAALDFFWASAGISLLLIPLIWFTRRSMSGGAAVAAD